MSLESVKNVLLILSGKGGVGKSSITTQLALSLCLAGKNVGILDVDLTGPSIPRMLGIEDAKIKQAPGGWLPVEVHASQELPPVIESNDTSNSSTSPPNAPSTSSNGVSSLETSANPTSNDPPPTTSTTPPSSSTKIGSLHAISLAFLLPSRSSAVIWRGPKKTAMVRQFLTDVLWPPAGIDYLLIDTPPGTSDEHIALAETLLSSTINNTPSSSPLPRAPILAGAVIVTTPQAVATSDVRKELNFCAKTTIPVVGVVENMAGFVCECCGEETNLFGKGGGEVMAQDFGKRFLGRLSLDVAWGRLVEEGRRPRYGEGQRNGGGDGVEVEQGKEVNRDRLQQETQNESPIKEALETPDSTLVDQAGQSQEVAEPDEGLLVDKYRYCRLWDTMAGITSQVIDIVDALHTRSG